MSAFLKITLMAMVTLCVFPVRLFVYQSLGIYFAVTLLSAVMLVAVSFYAFMQRAKTGFSVFAGFMFLWAGYIVLRTFAGGGEHYRVYLYTGYLCWFLSVFMSLKSGLLTRTSINLVFYIFGVVEAFVCILQTLGVVKSANAFFGITGTFENPNITAMFLMACIPVGLFYILKKHRIFGMAGTAILLLAIVLLKCRTVYIGTLIIFGIFFLKNEKTVIFLKKHRIIFAGGILAVLLSGIFLYYFKKNSADGRLFIWKISAEMIAEKPVFGSGYGLFEHDYNKAQAEYFRSGKASETEKQNAGHVNMAYNEYIEQTAEGGIFGLLFYAGFIVYGLYLALKQKDFEALAIILAVIVAGFFNFIIQCLPLCLLLFCYCASLDAKVRYANRMFFLIPLVLSVIFFANQSKLLFAQTQLKKAVTPAKHSLSNGQALQILQKNESRIETSEAFLRNYGKLLLYGKKYGEAKTVLEKATCYSSGIEIYFLLSACHSAQNNFAGAEQSLLTVAQMLPQNLQSRYMLMMLYNRFGKPEKTAQMASEIIEIKPKIKTREGEFYKSEAAKYLQKQNC